MKNDCGFMSWFGKYVHVNVTNVVAVVIECESLSRFENK